jgi:hypothetical protein
LIALQHRALAMHQLILHFIRYPVELKRLKSAKPLFGGSLLRLRLLDLHCWLRTGRLCYRLATFHLVHLSNGSRLFWPWQRLFHGSGGDKSKEDHVVGNFVRALILHQLLVLKFVQQTGRDLHPLARALYAACISDHTL